MKAKGPTLDFRTGQVLPLRETHLGRHQRVLCPACGGDQTGYYEVSVLRRQARVDSNCLQGDAIDSRLDQLHEVVDANSQTYCDCASCGYEWSPIL